MNRLVLALALFFGGASALTSSSDSTIQKYQWEVSAFARTFFFFHSKVRW